ncbi:MAG: DNA repair protein RadC [Firmicutes bacterium]|nr:DNA repair protein RadC [Bacillota bacterium]
MPFTSINIYTLKQVRTKRRRYDLEGSQITSPSVCYHLLQYLFDLESKTAEQFGIIALNTKHKIVGVHIIGSGTIDHVYIEPRQVYMAALMNNAKAIIAFHCHPSGDATPSRDDLILTQRLKKAGKIMCIELLDHLITGEGNYVSLREEGLV